LTFEQLIAASNPDKAKNGEFCFTKAVGYNLHSYLSPVILNKTLFRGL
jgi:hypothetical protein